MKKFFLLPFLLLTGCSGNSIPANDPYYCEQPSFVWMPVYPNYAFQGTIEKKGRNYYFVNREKTNHGFHGNIEEFTECYDRNEKVSFSDLKFDTETKVTALFSSGDIYQLNDKWIKITGNAVHETVWKLFLNMTKEEIEAWAYEVYFDECI